MELQLDDNGYPTEETLERIESWDCKNAEQARDLIQAISYIWWMPDWGLIWDGYKKLQLHTGGWSGNEDIIRALKNGALKGNYFWAMYWKAHFVGGHFHFEIK